MMIFKEYPVRDIEIETLSITFGTKYIKTITLTKNKIVCKKIISFTSGPLSLSRKYCEQIELEIYDELFKTLSDAIHDAGLLELLKPYTFSPPRPGAPVKSLLCEFNDGSRYNYITDDVPEKIFNDIVDILNPYSEFPEIEHDTPSDRYTNKPKLKLLETRCCNAIIYENWDFCPNCGKKLESNDKMKTEKTRDSDETGWLCKNCMCGGDFEYKFCGKCGQHRGW